VCGSDCLSSQYELFVNYPTDVKENDEHALDFALHLSQHFSASATLDLPCTAKAFFPKACLIIAKVSVALFLISAQDLMLFLCQLHDWK
jgi:hypothetical protein